jgi:Sec-independent protein translocase protein TatA
VLNLTPGEIGLAVFLFLLIFGVGYLPRIADRIGDWTHAKRRGGGPS